MKSITVLIGLILYVAGVNGRYFGDPKFEYNRFNNDRNKHLKSQTKGCCPPRSYESIAPQSYYNSQQEKILLKILYTLEEISLNIKRPQPPLPKPQPIYVPVPYPVPINNFTSIKLTENAANKEVPVPASDNYNGEKDISDFGLDDEDDGSRPITFDPVIANDFTVKQPPVEHGSIQAGAKFQYY